MEWWVYYRWRKTREKTERKDDYHDSLTLKKERKKLKKKRYKLKKKYQTYQNKIQGLKEAFHKSVAKDLCENNNQILISKFPVKGWLKNGKEKFIVQL